MSDPMIFANLLHLSYNMWGDWENPAVKSKYWACKPYLRFDEKLWNDLLLAMQKHGMNMVVIDVGDGIEFASHPEISVKNAWSHDKLKSELSKMRDMGLEPIPKLNFSTCHDTWLGPYSRHGFDAGVLQGVRGSHRRGRRPVRQAAVLPSRHGRGGSRAPDGLRIRHDAPASALVARHRVLLQASPLEAACSPGSGPTTSGTTPTSSTSRCRRTSSRATGTATPSAATPRASTAGRFNMDIECCQNVRRPRQGRLRPSADGQQLGNARQHHRHDEVLRTSTCQKKI